MLIEGIIIGLILAMFFKGDLRKLNKLEIKSFNLLILAFILRFIAYQVGFLHMPLNIMLGRLLNLFSLLLLIIIVYNNRSIRGMNLFLVGLTLNLLVMFFNHGAMPVHEGFAIKLGLENLLGTEYLTHIPMNSESKLNFLGDIIPIAYPIGNGKIISLGDLLQSLGIVKVIYVGTGAKRLSFLNQSAKIE